MAKDKYWQNLVNKHLVGRKIVKVEWIEVLKKQKDCLVGVSTMRNTLDNGTVLTPSADDQRNESGSIFTTITELGVYLVLGINDFKEYKGTKK